MVIMNVCSVLIYSYERMLGVVCKLDLPKNQRMYFFAGNKPCIVRLSWITPRFYLLHCFCDNHRLFDNRPKNQDKLMFSHLCFASVLTRRNCLQSTFLTKPFLCNCIKLLLIPNFCSNLISKPDDLIQLLTCVKCKLVCSLPILLLLEMHSPAFHSSNG